MMDELGVVLNLRYSNEFPCVSTALNRKVVCAAELDFLFNPIMWGRKSLDWEC